MKNKRLILSVASTLIAFFSGLTWWLYMKKENAASQESRKISVLLRGSLRESEALQRILQRYAAQHQPLEFEIFHQSMVSHEMPEVPFSLLWADAETLVGFKTRLKRFDSSAFRSGGELAPVLMQDGKSLGLPLYEHRFMTLYYDRSKISAKFGNWLDLVLTLMPLTKRAQHQYGLAFGEDAEHVLPFFPQLWQKPDSKIAENYHSAYEQLALLRHAFPIVPLDCPSPCADDLFKAGQAAMALAADTQLDEFAQALGQGRLGIMPLPSGKAPRQTQYLGVAAHLKKGDRQATEEFVHYLSSPDGQKEIFREFRSIPSLTLQSQRKLEDRLGDELLDYLRSSSLPVMESVYETARARLEPSLNPYLKGKIGETEAALALTHTGGDAHVRE